MQSHSLKKDADHSEPRRWVHQEKYPTVFIQQHRAYFTLYASILQYRVENKGDQKEKGSKQHQTEVICCLIGQNRPEEESVESLVLASLFAHIGFETLTNQLLQRHGLLLQVVPFLGFIEVGVFALTEFDTHLWHHTERIHR